LRVKKCEYLFSSLSLSSNTHAHTHAVCGCAVWVCDETLMKLDRQIIAPYTNIKKITSKVFFFSFSIVIKTRNLTTSTDFYILMIMRALELTQQSN